MARILITGAAGNIGKALTKHLSTNHNLILVDRSLNGFPERLKGDIHKVETDLTEKTAWTGLLNEIDYVIHLAANPNAFADFDDLWESNFIIPKYLFEHAANALNIKRIIFASSVHAVDGYPAGEEIKVTDVPRPDGYYGISKLYIESLANYFAYQRGVKSIGIRIGNYILSEDEVSEKDLIGLADIITERDFNHLIDCCLTADIGEPTMIVNGVSNNTFKRLEISTLKGLIGYNPQDNAFELMKKNENVD